jgi:hypothetical protein
MERILILPILLLLSTSCVCFTELKKDSNVLKITGQHLHTLSAEQLDAKDWIIELHLTGNHIRRISIRAFEGFKSIRTLNLSHNHLKNFPSRLLEGVVDLERLDLRYNRLSTITIAEVKLSYLDLSFNRIAFADVRCPALKVLDLSHNPFMDAALSVLDAPMLVKVNLSYTLICSTHLDLLQRCSTLRVLDISGTKVEKIELKSVMEMLPKLASIMLGKVAVVCVCKTLVPFADKIITDYQCFSRNQSIHDFLQQRCFSPSPLIGHNATYDELRPSSYRPMQGWYTGGFLLLAFTTFILCLLRGRIKDVLRVRCPCLELAPKIVIVNPYNVDQSDYVQVKYRYPPFADLDSAATRGASIPLVAIERETRSDIPDSDLRCEIVRVHPSCPLHSQRNTDR